MITDTQIDEVQTPPAEVSQDELFIKALRLAEDEVLKREIEFSRSASDHKTCKNALEAAQQRVHDLIREYGQPNLFSQEQNSASETSNTWREVNMLELDIDEKIRQILVENDLDTIGKIVDYGSDGKSLTDIVGIGPSKCEKIEDALERYFKHHPEFSRSNEAETMNQSDKATIEQE